jgi:hypothetical protein
MQFVSTSGAVVINCRKQFLLIGNRMSEARDLKPINGVGPQLISVRASLIYGIEAVVSPSTIIGLSVDAALSGLVLGILPTSGNS